MLLNDKSLYIKNIEITWKFFDCGSQSTPKFGDKAIPDGVGHTPCFNVPGPHTVPSLVVVRKVMVKSMVMKLMTMTIGMSRTKPLRLTGPKIGEIKSNLLKSGALSDDPIKRLMEKILLES